MKNKILIFILSIALSDYTLVEIDATNYSEWVYFSFTSGETIEIEENFGLGITVSLGEIMSLAVGG